MKLRTIYVGAFNGRHIVYLEIACSLGCESQPKRIKEKAAVHHKVKIIAVNSSFTKPL